MSREFVRTTMRAIGATLFNHDKTTDWWSIRTASVESRMYDIRETLPFTNLYCNRDPGGFIVYYDQPKHSTAERALLDISALAALAIHNNPDSPACDALREIVRKALAVVDPSPADEIFTLTPVEETE